jgi:FMN phosphatase YigB (HAD superfamily)
MSANSKLTAETKALWRERFAAADFTHIDIDYWNTLAHSPAKVHPRVLDKLGLSTALTPLNQVCREPVLLAQGIVGHRPPAESTSALDDLFLEHCMEMDPEQYCQCELDRLRTLVRNGSITQDEYLKAVHRAFLDATAAKFVGGKPSDEDHEDLAEVIRREQQWMSLFWDAEEFLVASRFRRRMNVISNMWYATETVFSTRKVHDLPLGEYFEHIITSSKVNARKPKPEPFWKSEQMTGTSLSQHLMVGDSIPNDVLAALEAGYRYAVLIHRDDELTDEVIESLPDNVLVVTSLMELHELLP